LKVWVTPNGETLTDEIKEVNAQPITDEDIKEEISENEPVTGGSMTPKR